MTNNTGSIILILLIVIAVSSFSSLLVLQSTLWFTKQINLAKLQQKSNEITTSKARLESITIAAGINLNSLPTIETTEHHFSNHTFTSTQTTKLESIINTPLNGYSINSNLKTQLVELITTTQSFMAKSNILINGFGCLSSTNNHLANQIEPIYLLDLDGDSNIDVSFELKPNEGEINKIGDTNETLIDFDLDEAKSFSRPAFATFKFETDTKLALVFVIQNVSPSTPTAENTLYVVFDDELLSSEVETPIDPNDLVDIDTKPVFSVTHSGYFLNLEQGQLISSAITIFNQQIIFLTQSPLSESATGITEYSNKMLVIDFDAGSPIVPDVYPVSSSRNLLVLNLNRQNQHTMTLTSQIGPLLDLPAECRQLYSYEN